LSCSAGKFAQTEGIFMLAFLQFLLVQILYLFH
jgi:hypothetical protein